MGAAQMGLGAQQFGQQQGAAGAGIGTSYLGQYPDVMSAPLSNIAVMGQGWSTASGYRTAGNSGRA
jgi:hypothetical protein